MIISSVESGVNRANGRGFLNSICDGAAGQARLKPCARRHIRFELPPFAYGQRFAVLLRVVLFSCGNGFGARIARVEQYVNWP